MRINQVIALTTYVTILFQTNSKKYRNNAINIANNALLQYAYIGKKRKGVLGRFVKGRKRRMDKKTYEKRGYLKEDFRIFYLEDLVSKEIEYHYHDFDKILVFFKGNIEYTIEGKAYTLIPNDIVMVPRGDSHKVQPLLHSLQDKSTEITGKSTEYVRLVIYLAPQFLMQYEEKGRNLRDCFLQVKERYSHVVRLNVKGEVPLLDLAKKLKYSLLNKENEPLSALFQKTLLLQFLILLNQEMEKESVHFVDTSRCNKKVVDIIQYINNCLTDEISIDSLAEKFYISKYHMMRQFKLETGYTVGSYMNQKRLLLARELLKQGEPVTKVYLDVGFKDYSTFVRAYKQLFGEIPSKRGLG